MSMRRFVPSEVPVPERHQLIIGSVGPRPIGFASTMSEDGTPNLAPYSFFNAFSSNPPTLVFSSNRRVRGNTTKDTLHNVEATGEVVINIVDYSIVRQMALASIEYPADINEFEKAGLTPIASEMVKPFRVKESPVQYECKVKQILPLGEEGGAGHLIICEVVLMHFSDHVFDDNGKIDPQKMDLMGRMGRAFYCRAHGENVFPIVQPVHQIGIGFDGLPKSLRESTVLTGNDLAQLASFEQLPGQAQVEAILQQKEIKNIVADTDEEERVIRLHQKAQAWIAEGRTAEAFAVVLIPEYN